MSVCALLYYPFFLNANMYDYYCLLFSGVLSILGNRQLQLLSARQISILSLRKVHGLISQPLMNNYNPEQLSNEMIICHKNYILQFYLRQQYKMLEQVQLNDEQCLTKITEQNSPREIIMMLKGFVAGYLGIPMSSPSMPSLMETITFYEEWIGNGYISNQNIIHIMIRSVKKLKNYHNSKCKSQEYFKAIEDFKINVEHLASRVFDDQHYFKNSQEAYNPKESILMSLNYTQNECTICSQLMEPQQVSILECTHVYHFQCLHQHVKNSINNGQVIVKCPSQYCGIQMDQNELMNFMTPQMHRKYQDFMMNQYVQKNGDNTSWCPTPDCNSLFQFDSSIAEYSCRKCRHKYCLKCKCEFHQNMSCQEYRDYVGMNPQDKSFFNFAKGAKYKQCPKCKFWVQKNQGCPTMRCRCRQQFCYQCGGVTCPHGVCSKNTNPNTNSISNRFR